MEESGKFGKENKGIKNNLTQLDHHSGVSLSTTWGKENIYLKKEQNQLCEEFIEEQRNLLHTGGCQFPNSFSEVGGKQQEYSQDEGTGKTHQLPDAKVDAEIVPELFQHGHVTSCLCSV